MTAAVLKSNPPIFVTLGIQGPPGPIGPQGGSGEQVFVRYAGEVVPALVVVWEDADGLVHPLSHTDTNHIYCALGLAISSAQVGESVRVQRMGAVDDESWSWTAGQRLYLAQDGRLTVTPPQDGAFFVVGTAVSPTRVLLNFYDPVLDAPL